MTQKANHFSAKRYCHANTFITPKALGNLSPVTPDAFANLSPELAHVYAEGVR
jgi:hypothetical protein